METHLTLNKIGCQFWQPLSCCGFVASRSSTMCAAKTISAAAVIFCQLRNKLIRLPLIGQ